MDPATEETPDMAKSENLGLFLRIRPLLQSGVRGDRNPRFRRKSAFEPWFQKMCLRVKTSRSVTLSPPLALERGRTKTEVYDGFSQVFSPDSSQVTSVLPFHFRLHFFFLAIMSTYFCLICVIELLIGGGV